MVTMPRREPPVTMPMLSSGSRSPLPPSMRQSVLSLTFLCLFALAGAAPAQQPPADMTQARVELAAIDAGLERSHEEEDLLRARDSVLAIQAGADQAVAERSPELESLDARLAGLGDAPADGGTEPVEIARQRLALQKQRNALDTEIRTARLTSVESAQLLDRIAGLRQARFRATLWERTTPPYLPRFWRALVSSEQRDRARLDGVWNEAAAAFAGSLRAQPARAPLLLALAVLVAVVARWINRSLLQRLATRWLPAGRLRRSGPALASVLVSLVATWLAATLLRGLLGDDPPARIDGLAGAFVGLVTFAALIVGLGRALLSHKRPSWRLPAISDEAAHALRPFPWAMALVVTLGAAAERVLTVANASLVLTVAASTATALLLLAVVFNALLRVRHLASRRETVPEAVAAQPHFTPWINAAILLGWIVAVVCALALATGFVAFASFAMQQLAWVLVVLSALYLAMRVVDDVVTTLLTSKGAAGSRLTERFGIAAGRVDQVAVVLSAALRVGLAMLAVVALLMPYGADADHLIGRALAVVRGIRIGELVLSPRNIVQALAVFVGVSVLVGVAQRWFGKRYLPTTRLDEGMRSSVVTLLGYAGFVLAVAMALAAIGVGLERIAWIASALSVGIGFGLQAIVQNFISGLILLAERPVKVGDWVIVGDAEGDIRRINVRATEIQTGDRTTVLVPNSELITKIVRNRTYANAQGLVKILLPMPLTTDVDLVRKLILEAFAEHPGLLEAPAPSVQIDGIDAAGRLVLNATGFVSSPRQAYGARSDILYAILKRLRTYGIKMG